MVDQDAQNLQIHGEPTGFLKRNDGQTGDVQSRDLKWRPFFSLVKKEVRRFSIVLGQTVITPMINSSLYLLIFGVSLGQHIADYHGHPYISFLIPGLIMMAALNNSYQNVSSSIVGSKFHGDLQDLKVVPLSGFQIVWAMSIAAVVRGLTVALITLLVSEVFYRFSQGQWMSIDSPAVALAFLFIGAISFAQIGIIVGFSARNFEQLNAVGSFILLPLLYLGGVFFSVQSLHPVWQYASKMNPLFYFINGTRIGFLGVSDVDILPAFLFSLVCFFVLHATALVSIKRGTFTRW
jgi:ABC-2 type transport system permease protein